MGYRFSTASTAIPKGVEPDWDAARHALETIELRTLWDLDGDLYPWESWIDDEFDWPPDPTGVFFALLNACDYLHAQLEFVRAAFQAGPSSELIVIDTPEHVLYVTGGTTVGEEPSLL